MLNHLGWLHLAIIAAVPVWLTWVSPSAILPLMLRLSLVGSQPDCGGKPRRKAPGTVLLSGPRRRRVNAMFCAEGPTYPG